MSDDKPPPNLDDSEKPPAEPPAEDGNGRRPAVLEGPPTEYPTTGPEAVVTIRYGKMQSRGRFRSRTPALIYGDRVVVQSERGVELGEVVFKAKRGEETRSMPVGWVLRRATAADREANDALNERLDGPGPEFKFCRERIQALDLAMRLVDVERPFGGGKIIFYFTADGRVDFRLLVRDLAKRFRTRIEMKQIGVRDEAKVLGDIADCGRELCCRTFLTKLQPISMRMAKVQKTTLDPAKISGRCGRLKCCLRYEYDTYLSLRESLPRSGARVRHERGLGVVSTMDILSQMVTVVFDEGERDAVHVETLSPAGPDAPPPPRWDRQPVGRPAPERSPPGDAMGTESGSAGAGDAPEAGDRDPESGSAGPAPTPGAAATDAGSADGGRQGERERRGSGDRRPDGRHAVGRRAGTDSAEGEKEPRRRRNRRRSEGGPSSSERPPATGGGAAAKPGARRDAKSGGGARGRPPRNRSRSDRPAAGGDAKGTERPRRPRRRPRGGDNKPKGRDGGAR